MTQMTAATMTNVANLLPPLAPRLEAKWRKALQIFRDDSGRTHGDIFTPTQIQIVDIIAKRRFPRTQLILPTQYGKSMSVADGVLLRVATHKERWAVIAPTEDKARIIMDYIIDRIFDDTMFTRKLEYIGTKEKLKQERSKTRITFRGYGEVRVYTGNATNTQATKKALMGFGAANIILDESSLVNDELYATVKRMLGGTKDNFLLEIGNPFYRNHFMRTWYGERYKKVFVDVHKALEEGRYTQDFIQEMQDEAFYDVLYLCLFPEAEEMLPNGYRRLVSDLVVDDALVDELPVWKYKKNESGEVLRNKWEFDIIDDQPVLGIDVAGTGKNKCKFVLRFPAHSFSMVAATSESDDLDVIADIAEDLIRRWNITDYRTVVDAGGVGHGLPAILKSRGYLVKSVLFGDKALEKAFLNMRAWMYWQARQWLKKDEGKLYRNVGFLEMKLVNYRQNASLKLQIEPKEEMIKRKAQEGARIESPDTADAFVLTFVDTSTIVEEDDIYVD